MYVDLQMTMGDQGSWFINGVTPAASRAVGQWPTAESLIGQLVAGLDTAAEREEDPEQRGRRSAKPPHYSAGRPVISQWISRRRSSSMAPDWAEAAPHRTENGDHTMPMTTSDYLNLADERVAMAADRDEPGEILAVSTIAQVSAIQAVAVAIDRLAEAVENLRT